MIHIADENECYKIVLECTDEVVSNYARAGFEHYQNLMVYKFLSSLQKSGIETTVHNERHLKKEKKFTEIKKYTNLPDSNKTKFEFDSKHV